MVGRQESFTTVVEVLVDVLVVAAIGQVSAKVSITVSVFIVVNRLSVSVHF